MRKHFTATGYPMTLSQPAMAPNPSVSRTPGKLRLPVPSGLWPPVAGYLERSASHA